MSFLNFFSFLYLIYISKESKLQNQFNLNVPKTREDIELNNKKRVSPKTDLICKNILFTYKLLGDSSFNIYKYCQNNFEMLGANSEIIKNNNPYCFSFINRYFCAYYYSSNNQDNCNSQSTNQILQKLKSLETKNKVENIENFCTKYFEENLRECLNTLGKFNNCITSKNLLYVDPEKDDDNLLKECYNSKYPIYDCIFNLNYYDDSEINLCSNYILPTVVGMTLNEDNNYMKIDENEYCQNYGDKMKIILEQYEEHILKQEKQFNDQKSIMKNILIFSQEEIFDKSHKILDLISLFNMKLQNITNVNEIFLNINKTLNFLDELMHYIDDERNEDDLSDKKLPLFKQFYGKLFENLKNLYDEISEKNEGNITQINNIIDKSKKFLKYIYSQVLRIKEQIQDNFIKIKEYEEKVENIIMNIDKQIKDYSLIIGK